MKSYCYFIILCFLLFFISCNKKNGNKSENIINEDSLKLIIDTNYQETQIIYKGKEFSVPSPTQMNLFLQNNCLDFDEKILNSTIKYKDYQSITKKALNVGIYGADLSYCNSFQENELSKSYLSVILELTKSLDINNIIDKSNIEKIKNSINNSDSLLLLSEELYKDIDLYLLENKRGDIGALIIAGAWIESTYLAGNIANKTNNEEIYLKIVEQKYSLKNLIALLIKNYAKENLKYDKLIGELTNLVEIYESMKIDYQYEGVETNEDERITIINSNVDIKYSKTEINKLITAIENIRNKITN